MLTLLGLTVASGCAEPANRGVESFGSDVRNVAFTVSVADSFALDAAEAYPVVGGWRPGELLVYDLASSRVLYATHADVALRTLGRSGSGPGEYRAATWLGWLEDQPAVLDPLNRRLLTFDNRGVPGPLLQLDGGIRNIVAGTRDSLILSGRLIRGEADSVDALVRIVNGRATRHVAIPFPADPAGRRFAAVHAAPCGRDVIAVVRSDTAVAWLVDRGSLQITAARRLPATLVRAADSDPEATAPDPQRFHFSGVLGDASGCVVLGLTPSESEVPEFTLYWLRTVSEPVFVGTVRTSLPLALRQDTLFSADGPLANGHLRIMATTVSP